MIKKLLLSIFIILLLTLPILVILNVLPNYLKKEGPRVNRWDVRSIDTVKYSRDLAREKMGDFEFDEVIDKQMTDIASTGATHVAISTPYDDEFSIYLKRWVTSARKHNLHVWFRGNFAGWEKWFEYKKITPEEHKKALDKFILGHLDLFESGDIFTPCPECENGGTGDPRDTKKVEEFRKFLIDEYNSSLFDFRTLNKNVDVGYFSMNYQVADLIMDKETTRSLGGRVVIDHYVKDPEVLINDAKKLAEKSGGQVVLGEFGAPIPDIHGEMTELQQANWIAKLLELAYQTPEIVGVNYWVNVGGSTGIWNDNGSSREAVKVIRKYYQHELSTEIV